MSSSIESGALLGALEKQLRLFRGLSADLVASRTAYGTMNLDAIYQHIASQTAICEEWREIENDRKTAWHAACTASGLDPEKSDLRELTARIDPNFAEPIRDVVTKLAIAEGELRNLNRTHSVLIEGSRRTLAILGNVLASFAPTYGRPSGTSESAAAVRRGAVR
ncbi:MAG: hypothetical protein ACRD40_01985 [Candidatus Acidiferrales bacterium]